jgi:lysophospholipase L1-like esterase
MNNMNRIIWFLLACCLVCSFKTKEISWVAIGDSITYLNDHSDETGQRMTKGYLTFVTEKLPNLHYSNQGHNGWTSGDIAREIDHLGLVKADLYSVFLGTNDWWQGRPLGSLQDYKNNTGNNTVYGSFRIIINKIRTLNPHAKIILVTPMQRMDFVYINDYNNNAYGSYKKKNGQSLEEFALAIDSIGKFEHVAVIDLYHTKALAIKRLVHFKRLKDPQTGAYTNYAYPQCTSIPFNPKDEYPYPPEAMDMTFDGLHPSDAGHKVIAHLLIRKIKKLALRSQFGGYK